MNLTEHKIQTMKRSDISNILYIDLHINKYSTFDVFEKTINRTFMYAGSMSVNVPIPRSGCISTTKTDLRQILILDQINHANAVK